MILSEKLEQIVSEYLLGNYYFGRQDRVSTVSNFKIGFSI
jgi:hypothetical protein